LKTVETIEEFIKRNGKIKDCGYFKHPDESDFEFPIKPKGRKIEGQDAGCLKIPRYAQT